LKLANYVLREGFLIEMTFDKLAEEFVASCIPGRNIIAFKRTAHKIYFGVGSSNLFHTLYI
jgi:hypothetical protein